MSREAMFRIYNPRFTIKSRKGADRLAGDLVSIVLRGEIDKALVIEVLRDKAKESAESARLFVERASESAKRNNGWAILSMHNARGYLIAARALERMA